METSARAYRLPTYVFGGFWARAAAAVIDGIALNLVLQPLDFLFNAALSRLASQGTISDDTAAILATAFAFAFGITISFLYYGVLQAHWKTTLGKRLFGLVLLGADLQPIDWKRGMKRYAMLIVSAIPFYAGLIATAFNPRKQGWHDRAARTVVVYPARLNAITQGVTVGAEDEFTRAA